MSSQEERIRRRERRIAIRREGADAGFDYSLLLLTFIIISFGMLMIYSSSSYSAQVKYGDSSYFLRRQAMNVAIGAVLMFIVSRINYRIFIDPVTGAHFHLIKWAYWGTVGLQIAVLLQGGGINGASRWLSIGPISFQPSEVTKVVIIILVSYYMCTIPESVSDTKKMFRMFIAVLLPLGLVAKEDLSSAIVIFIIAFLLGIMVA
ncbi:MAG: FtsW/RodA/SpoVE family cell cycle protein, partial [Eubacterium sp.]|nr:FtsW/RodA/SpoVE family cell cycle protein [Eubacterium sp.]